MILQLVSVVFLLWNVDAIDITRFDTATTLLFFGLPMLLFSQPALGEDTVRLFVDNNPAVGFARPRPGPFLEVNGTLFFGDNDGTGQELWSTDGNTIKVVADIDPDGDGCNPNYFIEYHDELYFVCKNWPNVYGGEGVWKSDGTSTGTVPVKTFDPAFYDAYRNFLRRIVFHDRLYFAYKSSSSNCSIWVLDGTSIELASPDQWSCDLGFFEFNERLFFYSGRYNTSPYLYVIEESPLVVRRWNDDGDLNVNPSGYAMAVVNDKLFFVGSRSSEGSGWDLFTTDGTLAGTHRLTNFARDKPIMTYFTQLGNRLAFIYDYYELWITDGTIEGTNFVLYPVWTYEYESVEFAGRLYYSAHGQSQLWVSGGTMDTTYKIADISVSSLRPFGKKLYFFSIDYDPATRKYLRIIRSIDADENINIEAYVEAGLGARGYSVEYEGRLFFSAINDTYGASVWVLEQANEPPVAICKDIMLHAVDGVCSILPVDVDGGSNDPDDPDGEGVSLSVSPETISAGDIDSSITLMITDDTGATDSCRATVSCNSPPVAICKEQITRSANENCQYKVSDPVAELAYEIGEYSYDIDGFSLDLHVNYSKPLGVGEHILELTVTDSDSAFDTCLSTVEVIDSEVLKDDHLDCGLGAIDKNEMLPTGRRVSYTKTNGCPSFATILGSKCMFCKNNKDRKDGGCQVEHDGDLLDLSGIEEPGIHIEVEVEVCDGQSQCTDFTCTYCTEERDTTTTGGSKSESRRRLGSMKDLSCPVNWNPVSDKFQCPMEFLTIDSKFASSIVEAGKWKKLEIKVKNIGRKDVSAATLSDALHELTEVTDLKVNDDVGTCIFVDSEMGCTLSLPKKSDTKIEIKFKAMSPPPPQFDDRVKSAVGNYGRFIFTNQHVLEVSTSGNGLAFLDGEEPNAGDWAVVILKDNKVKFTPPGDTEPFVLKLSCSDKVNAKSVNRAWDIASYSIGGKQTCSAVTIRNKGCIVGAAEKVFCDTATITIVEKEGSKSNEEEDSNISEEDRLIQDHAIDTRRHLLRSGGT